MGRNRKRYVYSLDLSVQKYRGVRIFHDSGVSFHCMILAESDARALEIAEKEEPGYSYEIIPMVCHRLFIDDKFLIK